MDRFFRLAQTSQPAGTKNLEVFVKKKTPLEITEKTVDIRRYVTAQPLRLA